MIVPYLPEKACAFGCVVIDECPGLPAHMQSAFGNAGELFAVVAQAAVGAAHGK